MTARSLHEKIARARRAAGGAWRNWRSFLLVLGLCALTAATLSSVARWRDAHATNAAIERLRSGHDVEIGEGAAPELLLARIAFLTIRDEVDRARLLVDALDRRGEAALRARAHYLVANALLRKTFDLIERGELDAAPPFVNLAKRDYRRALQLAPAFWDAKYNYDVASRLIRDYPAFEQEQGDELQADPRKLWTDTPGAPKGLP
ncbi:MxaK protein [Methylosinus sp. Sm6]|uniref:MxaK protein n=1 Tax=Methylosinus sp. Sm6 TaxID=2866948 RepID=UPI001C997D57|nr:MxaK protein [Methylosinus sp. Sm6]MBY6240858.1 MxaK protein [Methylosinus sp. Sm6]